MQVERIEVSRLTGDPANARKHGERNIRTIVESLSRFGQQKPIVVDSSFCVRAGNGTLEAARSLGWTHLDCVVTDLKGSDAIAYAIADNRTAELAEWDSGVLAATLEGLQLDDEALLAAAGFSEDELAELLKGIGAELDVEGGGGVTEDEVPEPPVDPVTKPGDLWTLGEHRVLCGDSTKAVDVARLMGGAKADLCFTSPPYGQQRDYTKESDCSDWDKLMRGVFGNLPMADAGQVLVNLGLIHRDGEWLPYWEGWIEWMRSQGWRRFGWYVWDQGPGLPGDWSGRLAPAFEFVFHLNRTAVKPNKTQECKHSGLIYENKGGLRGADGDVNEWSHKNQPVQSHKIPDSVCRESREKSSYLHGHPAMFSVKFAAYFLEAWNGAIYEPFCGSGTTLIAAEQLNRTCYGMEISPQYCDVIIKRWENLTGEKAVLDGNTGHANDGESTGATVADKARVSGRDNKATNSNRRKPKKQPA